MGDLLYRWTAIVFLPIGVELKIEYDGWFSLLGAIFMGISLLMIMDYVPKDPIQPWH